MKHLLPIIFLLILLLLQPQLSYSQNEVTDQSYTSYLTSLDIYRLSHQDYETAKAAYLKYKTPASQQDLLEKGKKILADRDNVLINYLNYLLLRLVISPGVNFSDQTIFQSKLKVEIQFYTNHKDGINAVFNLGDMTQKSQEAEKQYQITQSVVNYVRGIVLLGKIDYTATEVDKFASLLEVYTNSNPPPGKNSDLVARWSLEAKNNQLLSKNKTAEARAKFDKLASSYTIDASSTFNDGKISVLQSFQYLREQHSFLKQILETLTNG